MEREQLDTQMLTVLDVAERLVIGRSRVYELMANGSLRSVRIGGSRRIKLVDLEAFVAGLEPGLPSWD
jgi:excisionase family DNA binding protein